MVKRIFLISVLLVIGAKVFCLVPLYQFKITSFVASFPVIFITPQNFIAKKKVTRICTSYGSNNIGTIVIAYCLYRQLSEADVRPVLVLAETIRNAPDSYRGKPQQKNAFHQMVKDATSAFFKDNKSIGNHTGHERNDIINQQIILRCLPGTVHC